MVQYWIKVSKEAVSSSQCALEAFTMGPRLGTSPGVYTVTNPFGPETVPKLDLLF